MPVPFPVPEEIIVPEPFPIVIPETYVVPEIIPVPEIITIPEPIPEPPIYIPVPVPECRERKCHRHHHHHHHDGSGHHSGRFEDFSKDIVNDDEDDPLLIQDIESRKAKPTGDSAFEFMNPNLNVPNITPNNQIPPLMNPNQMFNHPPLFPPFPMDNRPFHLKMQSLERREINKTFIDADQFEYAQQRRRRRRNRGNAGRRRGNRRRGRRRGRG